MRTYWILAVVVSVLASVLSSGFHHYDEHYHVLEYLAFKIGLSGPDQLPWEFGARVRSWWLPALFYPFLQLERFLGITDPLLWAMSFRFLGAALNMGVIWALWTRLGGASSPFVLGLLCFLWFFPYLHVRTSIENWSGALFFLGLALSFQKNKGLLTGLLWGIAFELRLQIAPMIVGAMAWWVLCERTKSFEWYAKVGLGTASAIMLGLLIDYWGYGAWTLPWWNYLKDQFAHNRASTWGTAPIWYYFAESLLKAAPPISLILISAVLLSFWYFPKNILTWITVPFLVAHTLEPHKELRFLFPMLYAIPFQVGMVSQRLKGGRVYRAISWRAISWRAISCRSIWWGLIGLNYFLLFASILRPAEGRTQLYRYLQTHPPHSPIYWVEDNPYELFNMPLNFYKARGLELKHIEYSDVKRELLAKTSLTLVTSQFELPPESGLTSRCNRRFGVLPVWLARYNYGNWIQRTRVWTVYECT